MLQSWLISCSVISSSCIIGHWWWWFEPTRSKIADLVLRLIILGLCSNHWILGTFNLIFLLAWFFRNTFKFILRIFGFVYSNRFMCRKLRLIHQSRTRSTTLCTLLICILSSWRFRLCYFLNILLNLVTNFTTRELSAILALILTWCLSYRLGNELGPMRVSLLQTTQLALRRFLLNLVDLVLLLDLIGLIPRLLLLICKEHFS